MEILKPVEIGWKRLAIALDAIVNGINLRTPRKGDGILLTEGPSGVIISIEPKPNVQPPNTAGGGGTTSGKMQLQQVIVFDGGGNPVTLNVYTDGTFSGAGLQWKPVDVVTPPGCDPTTINVLTKS